MIRARPRRKVAFGIVAQVVSAQASNHPTGIKVAWGKILLTLGRRGEAEAGLRRALTIAQQQQARWWKLRAATTLAKHWRDDGKYLKAYSLLQPVYGLFVEGSDTASLKDAKALLGKLRDLSGPQTQAGRG